MKGTSFYSVKGGAGCTTVAAAFALLETRQHPRVTLKAKDYSDACAVLGLPMFPAGNSTQKVSHRLTLEPWGAPPDDIPTVYDYGLVGGNEEMPGARVFCVLRPCYLHLRRFQLSSIPATGIVLVDEPGRTLSRQDVEEVCGVPVVAQLCIDAAVARAIDSGLLATRVPQSLARSLSALGSAS